MDHSQKVIAEICKEVLNNMEKVFRNHGIDKRDYPALGMTVCFGLSVALAIEYKIPMSIVNNFLHDAYNSATVAELN